MEVKRLNFEELQTINGGNSYCGMLEHHMEIYLRTGQFLAFFSAAYDYLVYCGE